MTLSASELASLRSAASAILPDTCTVQTVARTSDGMGGWSEVWANTYTGVAFRLGVIRHGAELDNNGRIVAVESYIGTVKYDQALSPHDRIVHGGITYEVESLLDNHSWVTVKRATLKVLE